MMNIIQNFGQINFFKRERLGQVGFLSLVFLILLSGYLSYKARSDQWMVWKENKHVTYYDNKPMLSTTDGAYFIHIAALINSKNSILSQTEKRFYPEFNTNYRLKNNLVLLEKPSYFEIPLLSYIISWVSKLFNNDFLLTSNFLIPFMACLTCVSISMLFIAMGFGFEGVIAGAGASLSQSILVRTSIGRVDTDLLNIGFLYLILTLMYLALRARNVKVSFLLISLSGFSNFLFCWWYQKPGFLIPFLLTIIVINYYYKTTIKNNILHILLFTLFSGPLFALKSISNLLPFIQQVFFPPNKDVTSNALFFPDTWNTVTELQKLNLQDYIKLISGQGPEWVTIVGSIGFLLFVISNYRKSLILIIPLIFAFLGFFEAKRFIIYALPLFWFGFGFATLSFSRYALSLIPLFSFSYKSKTFQSLFSAMIIILLLGFNWINSIASCENSSFWNCNPKYVPQPSFSSSISKGFSSLSKLNDNLDGVAITWWDYGYWLGFLSKLNTIHDGGSHRSTKTYLIAKSLTTDNQQETYNILQYSVNSDIQKVFQDASVNKKYFNKKISSSISSKTPIYFILTRDMVKWWSTITYLGNWDIANGKAVDQTVFTRISCQPKSQKEMLCGDNILNVENGKISNGNQLSSLIISKDGNLIRYYDFKNINGKVSLLIEIINDQRSFYVINAKTVQSSFTQLFLLNQTNNKLFTLVDDGWPEYRVFKLNNY